MSFRPPQTCLFCGEEFYPEDEYDEYCSYACQDDDNPNPEYNSEEDR